MKGRDLGGQAARENALFEMQNGLATTAKIKKGWYVAAAACPVQRTLTCPPALSTAPNELCD